MACERRPGSSTKLASMESYATPASSTPARRSTCQSYLMLWPALGTAGSWSSATSGASAKSSIGGRFLTGVGRRELAAARTVAERQVPDFGRARGQREADQLGVVRLERVGLGVEGHERRRAEPRDQRRNVLRIVHDDDLERGLGVDGEPVVGGRRVTVAASRAATAPSSACGSSPAAGSAGDHASGLAPRSAQGDFLEARCARRQLAPAARPSPRRPPPRPALPSSAPARRTRAR